MELKDLKGLGPKRLESLRAAGINTLRDFLFFFPLRYEDHTTVTPCALRQEGTVLVEGRVIRSPVTQRYSGTVRTVLTLQDASGTLQVQWFHAPWIRQALAGKDHLRLYGRLSVHQGRAFLSNPKLVTESGWIPIYARIPGLPQETLRRMMSEALQEADHTCAEDLPAAFRTEHQLLPLADAVRKLHQPGDLDDIRHARRTIDFEKMLLYLSLVAGKRTGHQAATPFRLSENALTLYWSSLSFHPTMAQQRVLREIAGDLQKSTAMKRLVQGDVGCGKTAIAFGALYLSFVAGFQAAMMAPTEVLARQHYENARRVLAPLGVRCALLTGSTKLRERRDLLQALHDGACDAVFGTHALISEGVQYANLGLVITDEQHRFGVHQRTSLQHKGLNEKAVYPHVLVMSATPIPRSLALILYGDLDLSVVDELPGGRAGIQTRIVPESKRDDMYRFIRQELEQGHQAYVVCPLVETREEDESQEGGEERSAKAVFHELSAHQLSGYRIGLIWGGQKAEEKDLAIRQFRQGITQVLVATTVIEVGIDNPNATVMVIENAHRFGLSQLHQLRGRVGRGSLESWCFLLADQPGKLQILRDTNDGFLVSQKDLEIRGPGDLMGVRQSGEGMESLIAGGDLRLLDEASRCVRELQHSQQGLELLDLLERRAIRIFGNPEIGIS